MKNSSDQYNYFYPDSRSSHHHAYLFRPIEQLLSEVQAQLRKEKLSVLDLGCGNGSLSHEIAQRGHSVTGVDNSATGIQIAQRNFPDCRFLQASVYDLPYAILENAFDIVISVDVIEHLVYPRELLRAAKRCLRPDNGRLILTTPYHGYLKNLVLALTGKLDPHFTVLWDGGHIKFFSKNTLEKMIKQEGFINTRFKFLGRVPFLWKTMLCSSTPLEPRIPA